MKYVVIYIDEILDIEVPQIALATDSLEEAEQKLSELNRLDFYCWIAKEMA